MNKKEKKTFIKDKLTEIGIDAYYIALHSKKLKNVFLWDEITNISYALDTQSKALVRIGGETILFTKNGKYIWAEDKCTFDPTHLYRTESNRNILIYVLLKELAKKMKLPCRQIFI